MKRSGGFTIIETMLYLAVSTALMVSTILIISNQQKGTEFHQAVKDLENQFQDQFNDVSTGYFQRKDSTSCSLGSGTVNIQDTGGGVGTNGDCIQLARVFWFGDSAGNVIHTYSVLGRRLYNDNVNFGGSGYSRPVQTAEEATPATRDFLSDVITIPNGVRLVNSSGLEAPIGIMKQLGSVNTSKSVLANGAQGTKLVSFNSVTTDAQVMSEVSNTRDPNNWKDLTSSITLCLDSGTDKGMAKLEIGNYKQPNATKLTFVESC